ncbi:hypothetical protein [Alkalimarinus alittae]|uniref:Uncharacterized protein n=1 Tax=Alkalimarinus alittae TaxID=2961619 RepID=A0ABY6N7C2_9ALTE|nr:hypothetical protein [Alkalimarinus alittae]UZE97892.1 hypothetical protein NKI27_09200 [Alkalimarinus alittae]
MANQSVLSLDKTDNTLVPQDLFSERFTVDIYVCLGFSAARSTAMAVLCGLSYNKCQVQLKTVHLISYCDYFRLQFTYL